MRIHTFQVEQSFPLPLGEVFPFFSEARNLERITPPWLRFRILDPDEIVMAVGTRIRYRLRIHGIPFQWESEITAWEPPHRFVDEQIRGPYRQWIHEHRFEERDGSTIVTDTVEYAVLGGEIVRRLLVEPDIRKIFAYRQEVLTEILTPKEQPSCLTHD